MFAAHKKRNRRFQMMVLLLAIIILAPFGWRGYHPAEYALPLSKLPEGRIAQILLKQNDDFVQFARTGGDWAIANMHNYPIDNDSVQNFLSLIRHSRNLGLQAWGKDKIEQAHLQTNGEDALRVQLRDAQNQIIGDWVIGQSIGNEEYLARAENADQIFNLQLQRKPSAKLADWMGDFWQGLQKMDMAAIVLGVGEKAAVEMVRSDPKHSAWRIQNLPKGAELKPDSDITRLPTLFNARMFQSALPMVELQPDSDIRLRSQFITTGGIEIWVNQARKGNVIYSHFFAQSVNEGQQSWCDRFNAAHGNWAYQMDEEFNRLLGLRMDVTAKRSSSGGKYAPMS